MNEQKMHKSWNKLPYFNKELKRLKPLKAYQKSYTYNTLFSNGMPL